MRAVIHQKLPAKWIDREKLRDKGQFWTPNWVAEAMAAYVVQEANCVFDPGVGKGAFYTALKKTTKGIKFFGTDVDSQIINEAKTEGILWTLAEKYTPTERIADYTQVMMDLGATLCTRSKPRCSDCPLAKKCLANALGCADTIPVKKATKALPVRTATFLIIKKGRAVLLLKRPSKGIWGGLWSLPEIADQQDTKALRAYCRDQFQTKTPRFKPLPAFRHTFSHYHLDIFPVIVETEVCAIMEASQQIWYNLSRPKNLGLPKPIQTIIAGLA